MKKRNIIIIDAAGRDFHNSTHIIAAMSFTM